MTLPQLTSKQNPLLKKIRHLASAAHGPLLVAEGIRVLEEANRAGCGLEAAVISDAFGSAPREQALLADWQSRGIRIYQISASLFQSISSVRTPQGAIALVQAPAYALHTFEPPPNPLLLCAFGLQDPGNLGTLIRAAAAAGASLVCTTPGTVAARNPKALRSSAGAFFHIPVVEHLEAHALDAYCRRHGIRMFRTDARAGLAHTQADLQSPCALLLGNEGSGMADAAYAGLPALHIPMSGATESLNVAMAGSILLFEAQRQRQQPPERAGNFPAESIDSARP